MGNALKYLEMIYLITAGPVLTAIAAFGLLQIRIAKNNLRISSKRESYRLASEQVRFYLEHILDSTNDIYTAMKKENLKALREKSRYELRGDTLVLSFDSEINDVDSISEMASLHADCLNKIESFSIPFVSGVASEEVAFSAVGRTFTNSMRSFIPTLVIFGEGSFQNTKQLYNLWLRRVELENTSKQQASIKNKSEKIVPIKMHQIGINE